MACPLVMAAVTENGPDRDPERQQREKSGVHRWPPVYSVCVKSGEGTQEECHTACL